MNALTERQVEILEAIIKYGSNKGAARALCVSNRTIEKTMEAVRARLNVRNTLQAAVKYVLAKQGAK